MTFVSSWHLHDIYSPKYTIAKILTNFDANFAKKQQKVQVVVFYGPPCSAIAAVGWTSEMVSYISSLNNQDEFSNGFLGDLLGIRIELVASAESILPSNSRELVDFYRHVTSIRSFVHTHSSHSYLLQLGSILDRTRALSVVPRATSRRVS